ncbi:MAG: tyrosine--tRNA ligase [Puniceicoccales bacterium]|jgi:tyrosyl-tRNA synthetase|nr:tyrosine--tRNA ligase [Puniceicoccales bacterium]
MVEEAVELLFSGASHGIGREDIERKLKEGKTLTVKLGVDPTRPDLTLGHMVVFRKLRQFQDLGHRAIFLIGDYTTTIGDPSGRSQTRPLLSAEQIRANGATYMEQAFKILDEKRTTVRHNGEWFGSMSMGDTLLLAREMTVAQLMEREDFSKRYGSANPIAVVEFLYPLLQGYDSVALGADVELGGSDQLFNMLVGREMQKNRGTVGQAVIAMPLLVGLDGVRKMSKSYDNYVAFNDCARDMFGKLMSIPDSAMGDYYRLLLARGDWSMEASAPHPMEAKKQLAAEIVSIFHGPAAACGERENFENVFSEREAPAEMEEVDLAKFGSGPVDPIELLFSIGKFQSKNEIRRLIAQGAVRIDEEKLCPGDFIDGKSRHSSVLRVGRRQFFRLV